MKSIEKPVQKLLLLFCLALALPGCFRQYEYAKTVTNDTESAITLSYLCCGGVEDKSFVIEPGETRIIHECIYEGPGKVPDCAENPLDFTVLDAQGAEMDVDMEVPQNWDYSQEDKSITCNFTIHSSSISTKASH